MTVAALRRFLQKFPPETEILVRRYSDWQTMEASDWDESRGIPQGGWIMSTHESMTPEQRATAKRYVTCEGN